MHLSRALLVILAAAALVAVAAGCGSDSSSSTEGDEPASTTAQKPSGGSTTTTSAQEPTGGSGGNRDDRGSNQSAQAPASEEQEVSKATAEEDKSADQSIQEYGSEADESEEEEVVEAMRGFVEDFSNADYAAVCDDISSKVEAQFEAFMKAQKSGKAISCPEFLGKLIRSPEKGKANRILAGVVTNVRIGDGNAFLLVKPKGEKVSYFVFTREGDAWKPTSIALGTPLLP